MLRGEILVSEEKVSSIAEDWRKLQKKAGTTPFTDYEWFDACWTNLAKPKGKTLHVVTLWDDGRLVGVLPLLVMHRWRMLHILEGGWRDALFHMDMLLENPDHAKQLWDIVRESRLYDFAQIRDVDPESPCGRALAPIGEKHDIQRGYILNSQWKNGQEWLQTISKRTRANFSNSARRLERKGALQYCFYTASDISSRLIDDMIDQKRAWCIARKETSGLFDQPGGRPYLHRLMELAIQADQLRLFCLKCGEKIIAYNLFFAYRDTLYGKLISYDLGYSEGSPGTLINVHALVWAVDHGFKHIDFLIGAQPHKQRYSNIERDYVEYSFSVSFVGRVKERIFFGSRAFFRKAREAQKWLQNKKLAAASKGDVAESDKPSESESSKPKDA